MSIQIETVKTDAFSMDYFRFGQGEKSMVILPGLSVQSVMGFADMVADAYKVLAEDYTVYLLDRRKEMPDAYTVHDMAKDTAEAIRALGIKKVNLFGASQGGMIAMVMAMQQPDLVEKLVLGSTSACIDESQFQTVEKWIDLAKEGKKEELYLSFGEAVYPKAVYEQSKELMIEAAKTVTDEDLKRFIIQAEGMRGFDVKDNLDKIACPVLVIGDMDDQVLSAYASLQIAENLPNQEGVVLYMYNSYGHSAYDFAPDYKERLLNFFTQ